METNELKKIPGKALEQFQGAPTVLAMVLIIGACVGLVFMLEVGSQKLISEYIHTNTEAREEQFDRIESQIDRMWQLIEAQRKFLIRACVRGAFTEEDAKEAEKSLKISP